MIKLEELHLEKEKDFFEKLLAHNGWEPDVGWEFLISPNDTITNPNYNFSPDVNLKDVIISLQDCKTIRTILLQNKVEIKIKYNLFEIQIYIYDLDGSPDFLLDTIKIDSTEDGKTVGKNYGNFVVLIKETIEKYRTNIYNAITTELVDLRDISPNENLLVQSPFSPEEMFWEL